MNNYLLLLLLLLVTSNSLIAQVGIGELDTEIAPSAMLEIKSTNKGLLIPRVTYLQKMNIENPATSLLVYQTDAESGYYYYSNSAWVLLTTRLNYQSDVTKENQSNKSSDTTLSDITGTKFPTEIAVKTYVNTLENSKIRIGNDINLVAEVSVSGDAALSNTGVLTINNSVITTAKISNGTIGNEDLNKSNIPLSGFGNPIANLNLGGFVLSTLGLPIDDDDATTKGYVDSKIELEYNRAIIGETTIANNLISETNSRTNANLLKANIESPTFTGIPAAPTATLGTNTTQLASTAFVLENTDKYYSINASAEVSTTSATDQVIPGMTFSPQAGTYAVSFNADYLSSTDAITEQVSNDIATAYSQLKSMVTTVNHASTFGTNETLHPGVYATTAAGSLAGNLILDGNGDENAVFIFKFNGAFTTGAGSVVSLINGAKACNVYWITIGSYAIGMGASTTMKGTLIASAANAMGAEGNLEGRLLSISGAVAFGPGVGTIPTGTSMIDLGNATGVILFTSSGGIGNTGTSTITGNIGTHSGAITGFETSNIDGAFFTPIINLSAKTTFSVFQNGQLIENSSRIRYTSSTTPDITLQAMAIVSSGQSIEVRWKTDVGILIMRDRILTLIKVR